MKINLQKMIIGAILISSAMTAFGAPKFNNKKVDYTTEEAAITNSTAVMLTSVAGDNYAIGYVSLGSLNNSVKAVKKN